MIVSKCSLRPWTIRMLSKYIPAQTICFSILIFFFGKKNKLYIVSQQLVHPSKICAFRLRLPMKGNEVLSEEKINVRLSFGITMGIKCLLGPWEMFTSCTEVRLASCKRGFVRSHHISNLGQIQGQSYRNIPTVFGGCSKSGRSSEGDMILKISKNVEGKNTGIWRDDFTQ